MEVSPGIHRIRIPMPDAVLGYTDAYLVQGKHDWLLIDTGVDNDEAFDALESQIREVGLGFTDISQIVLTHTHTDHYGLAGKVKQLSQARLVFHQAENALIEQRYVNAGSYFIEWAQQLKDNGMPDAELPKLQRSSPAAGDPARSFTFSDTELQGGEILSTGLFNLEVIWTPGHSPGHICLYEPRQKVLFTGDHILPVTIPNVSYPQPMEDPLGKYLASLKQLAQLEVELVLPAHEHSFTDLKQRIGEIIRYRQRRLTAILQVMGDGPRTPYQIASDIPWLMKSEEDKGTSYKDLAIWDKRLALGETTSHLELLRCEGKMERFSRDNVFFYRSTKRSDIA